MQKCGLGRVRCCLRPGTLGHFLALQAEVSLIVVALAELVRTQQQNAPDAGQNANAPGMPTVPIYMGVGCTHVKDGMLESVAACHQIGAAITLIVYHFVSGVVEHMVGCFAAFRSFVFLLKLSSHFVVFAVFCEMTCVFTTHDTIRYPLVPSPSFAITSTMGLPLCLLLILSNQAICLS